MSRVIGIALFVTSLFLYRSHTKRPVLGLWSYSFFIVLVAAIMLLVVTVWSLWRAQRRVNQRTDARWSVLTADLAVFSWGIAYFLSAIDDSSAAGRITDLNFWGSIVPVAALLEWITLVLLVFSASIFVAPKLKGKWVSIGLVLGTIIMILVLLEGIIRVKVIIAPATQGYPTYSSMLWTRRYVQLNQQGFRDVEHAIAKNPGICRLLIIGDSFAYGWGIKRVEDRFGEQLASKLNQRTGEYWEVMNASRGDTHTLDHISFLKRMLAYRPDVVVVVYVFNDIDYLYPVTSRGGLASAPPSLLHRIHPLRLFYKNSYLFQEVYVRFRHLYYRLWNEAKQQIDPYTESSLVSRHLQDLSTLITTAAQTGALIRVVPFDISITYSAANRRRYENFVSQAATFGIPVWTLNQTFTGLQFSQLTVNELDAHPNELANLLAADAVGEQLLRALDNQREKD
jgi:hypothetical protein